MVPCNEKLTSNQNFWLMSSYSLTGWCSNVCWLWNMLRSRVWRYGYQKSGKWSSISYQYKGCVFLNCCTWRLKLLKWFWAESSSKTSKLLGFRRRVDPDCKPDRCETNYASFKVFSEHLARKKKSYPELGLGLKKRYRAFLCRVQPILWPENEWRRFNALLEQSLA